MAILNIALSQTITNSPPWIILDGGPSSYENPVGLMTVGEIVVSGVGYGVLYNGYCIAYGNFAPTDWTIPTYDNYNTLNNYLGGWEVTGGKMKESGFDHWDSPNTSATNSSNFTGVGAGYRINTGSFVSFRQFASIAFYPKYGVNNLYAAHLSYLNDNGGFWQHSTVSNIILFGLSVRLLYTGTGTPSTVDDYDSNTYDVELIGTQYWTKQNWKCTHLNDGTAITKVTSDTTWNTASTGDYYYCAPNNNDANI